MRAKEFLYANRQALKHSETIGQVVCDLLPLRRSKEATDEYVGNRLSADIRYQHFQLRKNLYTRGNALQPESPTYEQIEGEVPMEVAAEVRDELFQVIRADGSFGYLFYILGTEQNSRHNSDPIDCIPNAERIAQCIDENRDDYPQTNLDHFLSDDFNYHQYDTLMKGHYWEDDDAVYLAYFNRVYAIFDELRLRKHSISGVRQFLRKQLFANDVQKYWTFAYISDIIAQYHSEDARLCRCRHELLRITEPLCSAVVKCETELQEKSPVFLNARKGNKLDMIRVFNALYEMGKFVDGKGCKLTKKDFFVAAGQFLNIDLSHYDKDLSNSTASSVAFEKQVRIFDEMKEMMTAIYNRR